MTAVGHKKYIYSYFSAPVANRKIFSKFHLDFTYGFFSYSKHTVLFGVIGTILALINYFCTLVLLIMILFIRYDYHQEICF